MGFILSIKTHLSFLRYFLSIAIDIKLSLMRYLPRTHKKARSDWKSSELTQRAR